jgi:hypothetical protein
MSLGTPTDDPTCTGTTSAARNVNDLYEDGIFTVVAAGNNGNSSTTDCTVNSPGAAIGAFTVGSYGAVGDVTAADLDTAPISTISSRGGTLNEGGQRAIVDITAPGCRNRMFGTNGNSGNAAYDQFSCGTSFAAPQVSGLALNLIDWARREQSSFLDSNPGLLHAILLTMADGQEQPGGTSPLSQADNLWGAGRLRARLWNSAGLDAPWSFKAASTCVGQNETVIIPIAGTPNADINSIKAAIYWYDVRHETGTTPDKLNLSMGGVDGSLYRVSNAATTNYEFVTARSGYGGTDNIGAAQSEIRITGVQVTSDVAGCGTNRMLVHYAIVAEDSDRDDVDGPTLAEIERE